jgi:hypothetical protein
MIGGDRRPCLSDAGAVPRGGVEQAEHEARGFTPERDV